MIQASRRNEQRRCADTRANEGAHQSLVERADAFQVEECCAKCGAQSASNRSTDDKSITSWIPAVIAALGHHLISSESAEQQAEHESTGRGGKAYRSDRGFLQGQISIRLIQREEAG